MSIPIAAILAPESQAAPGNRTAAAAAAAVPCAPVPRPAGWGWALPILATVAVVLALKLAQGFAVSLLLGILFAYTLNPLVALLDRARLPRAASASIVMAGVVGALLLGCYALREQAQAIFDQLPVATSKLSAGLASMREGEVSTMQKMQTAATELEQATSQATGTVSTPTRVATLVVIDPPAFKLSSLLWAGSMSAAGMLGQAAMVLFLTYFLLLSGDTYKRKLVQLTGPSLSRRKVTVQVLDDINQSIQRYMLMLLAANVLVGLLSWIVFRWIGLENAGAWGVAAGLLHVVPYFGAAVTAAAIGMAAYVQFGPPLSMALLVAGASLAVSTGIGIFVTTWMAGRIARMNTAAVFVSLLFWTWLWGVWGMLLSVPIIAIVRVVAQRVEPFKPVAELLGD